MSINAQMAQYREQLRMKREILQEMKKPLGILPSPLTLEYNFDSQELVVKFDTVEINSKGYEVP